MNRIALTFIGKDRPGIIAQVSGILSEAGWNIEDTTMTILEGEFAMILIASVPGKGLLPEVKQALNRLKRRWGLHWFVKGLQGRVALGEKHPEGTASYVVSVAGRDRTGIVHQTSRILAKHHLNITDLNSKLVGPKGRPIFAMILEVDVPKRFSFKRLEPEWRRLRRTLGVDVTVRKLERLNL